MSRRPRWVRSGTGRLGHFPKGALRQPGLRRAAAGGCNVVKVWWLTQAGKPGRPATREPAYITCEVRGEHTVHQGAGGIRW